MSTENGKAQEFERFKCCNAMQVLGHDRTCKSKEQEPDDQDKAQGPCVWYDSEKSPQTMYVSIPLHGLARTPVGTCRLRGWIEEYVKGLALRIIQQIRIAEHERKQKIFIPSGPAPQQPGVLKVH